MRRLTLGNAVVTGLSKTGQDRDITIRTRCRMIVMRSLLFPEAVNPGI